MSRHFAALLASLSIVSVAFAGEAPSAPSITDAAAPVRFEVQSPSMKLADAPDPDKWRFLIAPYLWIPAMNGNVTVRGNSAEVDIDMWDTFDLIKDNFNFATQLHFEVSKGKFTFFADAMYLNLEGQNVGEFSTEKVNFEQGVFELGMAYMLIDKPLNPNYQYQLLLEPLAGARIWYVSSTISDSRLTRDVSGSESWVDGFIGARGTLKFNETWAVFARGDIGAGGSEFTWNAVAGIDIRLATWCFLEIGYRALDDDYSKGSGSDKFTYDMLLYGPFLAFSFKF